MPGTWKAPNKCPLSGRQGMGRANRMYQYKGNQDEAAREAGDVAQQPKKQVS